MSFAWAESAKMLQINPYSLLDNLTYMWRRDNCCNLDEIEHIKMIT